MTKGFLKKLPAFGIISGFGSFERLISQTISLISEAVGLVSFLSCSDTFKGAYVVTRFATVLSFRVIPVMMYFPGCLLKRLSRYPN